MRPNGGRKGRADMWRMLEDVNKEMIGTEAVWGRNREWKGEHVEGVGKRL